MKKMGIKAIYRPPEHLETSAGARKLAVTRPNQVGNGPDLHPHGAGVCLSVRRRGLVQPEGFVMAVAITMEAAFCIEAVEGHVMAGRKSSNTDPGIAVPPIDFTAVLKGQLPSRWMAGCVARQCLRRAALAVRQITRKSTSHALQDLCPRHALASPDI